MRKNTVISIIIIILIIFLVIYIKTRNPAEVNQELAKCIGENSILYSQIGCIHCEKQKELFGESVQFLNIYECNNNWTYCDEKGITGTPTWIINEKKYIGVQDIKTLKDLTGC